MSSPVPVWTQPDWRDSPGAELASVPGDDIEFASNYGLAYDDKSGEWVSPRIHALRTRTLSIDDLDDEELIRGQVRDADGRFRASAQKKIPREFHDELMRRILAVGTEKLRRNYLEAVDTLTELMTNTQTDDRLRADLAKYIIERLAGKTPDRVEMAVAVQPWERVLKTIIKEIPEIEDAEVVEDDDDD